MTLRKYSAWLLMIIVLGSLAACGGGTDPAPTPTVPVTIAVTAMLSPTAPATPSPSAIAEQPTTGAALEIRTAEAGFPTPDVEKRLAEMAPTAVIVEGAHPYPTANSAIDSDGDGFQTLDEWKQAIRETYPAYDWPEAYTPSVDDVLTMMSMDMFAPGSTFEVPAELVALGNVYQCAWQQNWIDAFGVGDQAEMDRSMRMLRAAVLTNPTNIYVISEYAEMYNLAELGDPAMLLRSMSNCVGFNRWVQERGAVAPLQRTAYKRPLPYPT